MSMINDYTYQTLTDQRERDLARLASKQPAGPAGTERSSELVAQAAGASQSIALRAPPQQSEQRGMATPQHRVAH